MYNAGNAEAEGNDVKRVWDELGLIKKTLFKMLSEAQMKIQFKDTSMFTLQQRRKDAVEDLQIVE